MNRIKDSFITDGKCTGLGLNRCVLIVGFGVFFVVLPFSLHTFRIFMQKLRIFVALNLLIRS